MRVNPDQEYLIQYKRWWSRFSMRKADQLVLVPKWHHLWMEWIWVVWTQLLDPTCKAKWLKYLTWYIREMFILGRKKVFYSIRSLLSAQNGQILSQLLSGPLMKFGAKLWKIIWTQPFGLDQILYCFVSLKNEIFATTVT